MNYKQAKRRHVKEDVHMPSSVGFIKRYENKPYHYVHFSKTVTPWEPAVPDKEKTGYSEQKRQLLWGLYLQSHYDTPVGIYGFPITSDTIKDLEDLENKSNSYDGKKVLKFKADAAGIIIFKAKNPETVLDVGKYTEDNLNRDVDKIKAILAPLVFQNQDRLKEKINSSENIIAKYQEKLDQLLIKNKEITDRLLATEDPRQKQVLTDKLQEIERNTVFLGDKKIKETSNFNNLKTLYKSDVDLEGKVDSTIDALYKKSLTSRRVNNPTSGLFYIIRFLHDRSGALGLNIANKFLFRKMLTMLGYSGVHDPGTGVIHGNEPHQAVYFSTSDIDILDIVKNPAQEKVKWKGTSPKTGLPTYEVANELKDLLTQSTGPIDLSKYTKTKVEELIRIITDETTDAERWFVSKKMLSRDLGILIDDTNDRVRAEVAKRAPIDLVLTMAKDPSMLVKEELVKRYEGSALAKLIKDHILSPSIISAALENPALDEKYKKVLSEQYNKVITRSISQEAWDKAKKNRFETLKEEVLNAANDSTIASYIDGIFRVLGNPLKNTYKGDRYAFNDFMEVLGQTFPTSLYNYHYPYVRKAAAYGLIKNGSDLVMKMVHDPDVNVRLVLASHGGKAIANLLLEDDNETVILHAVSSADPKLLRKLINYPSERIQHSVARKIDPEYAVEMFKIGSGATKDILVRRKDMPEELYTLAVFSEGMSDSIVRSGLYHMTDEQIKTIALNTSLNDNLRLEALSSIEGKLLANDFVKFVEKLFHDPSKAIRMWLAALSKGPNTLMELLNDPDDDVVIHYLAFHKYQHLSEDNVKDLLSRKNAAIDDEICKMYYIPWNPLVNSVSSVARAKAAANIGTKDLLKLINDESETVRRAVAQRIDGEHLSQMLEDPDDQVRTLVARRIDSEQLIDLFHDPVAAVRLAVSSRIPYRYVQIMKDQEFVFGQKGYEGNVLHKQILNILDNRLKRVEGLKNPDRDIQTNNASTISAEDLDANFDTVLHTGPNAKVVAIQKMPSSKSLYFLKDEDSNVRAAAINRILSDTELETKYYQMIKELVEYDQPAPKLAFIAKAKINDVLPYVDDPDDSVSNTATQQILSKLDNNEQFLNRAFDKINVLNNYTRRILYDTSPENIIEKNIKKILLNENEVIILKVVHKVSSKLLPLFIDAPCWQHYDVRLRVAQIIEPKYLPLMMKDKSYDIRGYVAKRIPLEYLSKMLGNEILVFNGDYDVITAVAKRMSSEEYQKWYHKYQTIRARIVAAKKGKKKKDVNEDDTCPECGCDCPYCSCDKKECPNCGCGSNPCPDCDCNCPECTCDTEECPNCGCGYDPCPECGCHCENCTCESEQCPECGCGFDDCPDCGCHCENCTCENEKCSDCSCGFDDCQECGCHCEDCTCDKEKCPNCGCGEDEDEDDVQDSRDTKKKIKNKKIKIRSKIIKQQIPKLADRHEKIKRTHNKDVLRNMLRNEDSPDLRKLIRQKLLSLSLPSP